MRETGFWDENLAPVFYLLDYVMGLCCTYDVLEQLNGYVLLDGIDSDNFRIGTWEGNGTRH